jgi:hypothetical protein
LRWYLGHSGRTTRLDHTVSSSSSYNILQLPIQLQEWVGRIGRRGPRTGKADEEQPWWEGAVQNFEDAGCREF